MTVTARLCYRGVAERMEESSPMSTLVLVRHGQASFLQDDYDQLSPTGVAQAEALGQSWAALDQHFDQIFIGPRRRHRQTYAGVARAYESYDRAWPDPMLLPELDEHSGHLVLEWRLQQLVAEDAAIDSLVQRSQAGDLAARRAYLKLFQQITQQWVRGEFAGVEHESWAVFRERVQAGIVRITEQADSGRTIVAFTSGGVIGVVLGLALDLRDEQIMELSWAIRNASWSEFRFGAGRFSLSVFNATPHLLRPELLTYV